MKSVYDQKFHLEGLRVKLCRKMDRVHAVEADVLRSYQVVDARRHQLDFVAEDLRGHPATELLVGLVEDEAKDVGPLAEDRDLVEVDPHLDSHVLVHFLKFSQMFKAWFKSFIKSEVKK